MDSYIDRIGLPEKSVRFLYDGERIKETDTPDIVILFINLILA